MGLIFVVVFFLEFTHFHLLGGFSSLDSGNEYLVVVELHDEDHEESGED